MKKNASIIVLLCLLILIVIFSGCTTNNNTSNQSGQDVILQITSNSPWNGTLTYNSANYNISGIKNKNYNLGPNPGHVAIYLKKNNDVGKVTVQLLQGSNIIQTQSISSHQEAINISHNF